MAGRVAVKTDMESRLAGRRIDGGAAGDREIEWQFDALDVRPVSRWIEAHAGEYPDGLTVVSGEKKEIADSYLDTGDWRIYRAGFALRVRRRGQAAEATMKSLEEVEDGPRNRREISEVLTMPEDGRLDEALRGAEGPVGERLKALIGGAVLEPLFEVKTRRRSYRLELEGGIAAGEVALDETEIPLEDGEEPVYLRRVEVELDPADGEIELVQPFVEQLRAGCQLTPALSSKYEAALLACGLEPPGPPELGPVGVDANSTTGEVAYSVLREQFAKFLSHEPGTRLGEDPEELHDMRVASRRMRAAMQIFAEALPVRSRRLRDELKWIAGALGEVRDIDVQLEQSGEWIEAAGPEDQEPLGAMAGVLEERRAAARKRMLRTLDSRRYARFLEAYSAFLRRGPARTNRVAKQPVLIAAPDLVRGPYRRVRKRGDRIAGDTEAATAEDYHKLRVRCKRLRYAMEFLSGVYGERAGSLIRLLKELQDVLGDHQDAEVAIHQLRELVSSRRGKLPPETIFAMGAISQRYTMQAEEMRGLFPGAYKKIRGKRWKRMKKMMQKMSETQTRGSVERHS